MSGRHVSRVLESNLAPDLKFTAAVFASFADDEGICWPAIGHVAFLRGLEERRVQYHVKELRRMEILSVDRPATQWHPTRYRLQLEHLPTRAAYRPPDRQPSLSDPPGVHSSAPLNSGVHSAAPQPGVHSTVPGVHSSAPDPSVRSVSTHTRTADAREADEPTLPLVGATPDGSTDHAAHAWCGRICVPKFLHRQFKRALGGPVTNRAGRMREFYAATIAAMPAAEPIGAEPVKFWRSAFAARFDRPAAVRELKVITGDDVWADILRRLEAKVNRHTFTTWFLGTGLVEDRGDVIAIAASGPHSDLHAAWIQKHYADVVHQAVEEVRPGARVEFVAGEARKQA